MKEMLVIGIYEDTGDTFTHLARTGDRDAAVREAALDADEAADQLILLGIVHGERLMFEHLAGAHGESIYASHVQGLDGSHE